MCGIVGFVGKKRAAPVLLEGLKRLEYRGYDSAGIAVLDGGKLQLERKKGRVKELDSAANLNGNIGIGHTRWATHGVPSERNAHPHVWGKYALVHNGIIENEHILREECLARGEQFLSDTDSEVIAHLIMHEEGAPLDALRAVTKRLTGSYALGVLCVDEPNKLFCARKGSPLVVGAGKDGLYAASDISAIASECDKVYALDEGEFAVLEGEKIQLFNGELKPVTRDALAFDREASTPDLMGYHHFMRKEMSEIPAVLARSATDISQNSQLYEVLCHTEYIHIMACGTAYHAGMCAKYAIEKLCRVPVEVRIASEYRYSDPIIQKGTLAIAVSQSGETADTLAAAELAKARGATLVAVTNVEYSSLTRLAHFVLPTRAGQEVAVAATKSFNAQLSVLYSLARAIAKIKGYAAPDPAALSKLSAKALACADGVQSWAAHFALAHSVYFIGRGADYCAALEGSLKLKEISYLPSEGYPAGELKHGTLALIDGRTPVVALVTQKALAEKTMNAVSEVRARGAKVFLITSFPELCKREGVYASVLLPPCEEVYSPALSVIPLQALAYYTALSRGNDPDKPRNLAKSVTVE